MAIQIQLRQGTTTEHDTFTGAVGEVTVDTTKDTLVVHDGVTVGGHPVAARANADGTISLIKKDGTSAGSVNATGLFNNTLTSTATDQALTAAQGKVLQDTKLNTTSAFGIGQTWQDVKSSRAVDTNYTNATGKAIVVNVSAGGYGAVSTITATVGGVSFVIAGDATPYNTVPVGNVTIPAGATYKISATAAAVTTWYELR